ncbi:MAG TPA: hypothetical protein DEO70_06620 [Bacteroidales bacterium]|nr:MAG: hypothetical protein A2X11_08660 [Bacteroidetes bacterium GWE2_42_24]OFY31855.1 MAG: hypothetical protein A2X09_09755 [Bacteroidetes bacterium GWF2_43_11]HBZ66493.1 hypothetical protein [Bacteroidales bacterium]
MITLQTYIEDILNEALENSNYIDRAFLSSNIKQSVAKLLSTIQKISNVIVEENRKLFIYESDLEKISKLLQCVNIEKFLYQSFCIALDNKEIHMGNQELNFYNALVFHVDLKGKELKKVCTSVLPTTKYQFEELIEWHSILFELLSTKYNEYIPDDDWFDYANIFLNYKPVLFDSRITSKFNNKKGSNMKYENEKQIPIETRINVALSLLQEIQDNVNLTDSSEYNYSDRFGNISKTLSSLNSQLSAEWIIFNRFQDLGLSPGNDQYKIALINLENTLEKFKEFYIKELYTFYKQIENNKIQYGIDNNGSKRNQLDTIGKVLAIGNTASSILINMYNTFKKD